MYVLHAMAKRIHGEARIPVAASTEAPALRRVSSTRTTGVVDARRWASWVFINAE